jgi:hypothetical protein
LSRNEVERDYAYNRRLFKRIAHGWYQINPELAIRRRSAPGESWQGVLEALNLTLVHELAHPNQWHISGELWRLAGGADLPVPIAAEAWEAREQAAIDALPVPRSPLPPVPAESWEIPELPERAPPPWGSPAAKRVAREELQRRIEAQRKGAKN